MECKRKWMTWENAKALLAVLVILGIATLFSIPDSWAATPDCTREKVIWLLQSGTYGPISWDTPSVVDWYYEKICLNPKAAAATSYVPLAQNRTEVKNLNDTHEMKLVFEYGKNIYNITREKAVVAPVVPNSSLGTYTSVATPSTSLGLCSGRFTEPFKYAIFSHELSFNQTFSPDFTRPSSKASSTDYATAPVRGYANGSRFEMKNATDWQTYERYWVQTYADYLLLCGSISLEDYARIMKNLQRGLYAG